MWTRTDIDPRAGHTVVIVFFELYLSFTLIKWDELVCEPTYMDVVMERRLFNDRKSSCTFRQLEYQILFVNLITIHM